ncbi:uncharacterized protein LOC129304252 [Prosopis cineraria]|uniref:uncharacterized protein LOC129304252 n=1 Tax=Prosopis cineraria TaxID=364024 RepID=UPI00241015C6|nr:uncharacterized protein LOC129304252 [Prosopis cineraria]
MEGFHPHHHLHHHQYLMWLKRKQMLKSHIEAATSWGERAFIAEDAARILGGRDRARLKQSQGGGGASVPHLHHHYQNVNDCKGSSDSEVIEVNGREEDYVETDLSVGLLPAADEDALSCKRPKTSNISSVQLPVFIKPFSSNDHAAGLVFQSAEMVIGVKKPKMEDLDLELRLGKVK